VFANAVPLNSNGSPAKQESRVVLDNLMLGGTLALTARNHGGKPVIVATIQHHGAIVCASKLAKNALGGEVAAISCET